jgi:hypothetical protein
VETEFVTFFGHHLGLTDFLLALFTGLIVLVTALLVVVTYQQSRHFKQVERAFVAAESISVWDQGTTWNPTETAPVINPSRERYVACRILIKNSGRTPAYDVLHWGEIEILRMSEEWRLQFPKALDRRSVTAIAPGGVAVKTVGRLARLTNEEIEGIRVGSSAIYVHGILQYRDSFQNRRTSTYRLFYQGEYPPPAIVNLNFCDTGNEAD